MTSAGKNTIVPGNSAAIAGVMTATAAQTAKAPSSPPTAAVQPTAEIATGTESAYTPQRIPLDAAHLRGPGIVTARPARASRHPLGPQLWLSSSGLPPASELLLPVRNALFPIASKPKQGGLWTSSYDAATGDSPWLHFLQQQAADGDEPPRELRHPRFVLYPAANARVLVIRSIVDYAELRARYRREVQEGDLFLPQDVGLDFERLAAEYDALHLTLEGSLDIDDPAALYGWDIESTLWFRWAFEDSIVRCQP